MRKLLSRDSNPGRNIQYIRKTFLSSYSHDRDFFDLGVPSRPRTGEWRLPSGGGVDCVVGLRRWEHGPIVAAVQQFHLMRRPANPTTLGSLPTWERQVEQKDLTVMPLSAEPPFVLLGILNYGCTD